MAEARTTITGNLTADPQLRFTASGKAVANFTVCENRRKRSASGGWEDDEPLFMACTAWGELGEHLAETAGRGTRVTVSGRLVPNSWTAEDGTPRRSIELSADDVAVSLMFATATVAKAQRPAASVPA